MFNHLGSLVKYTYVTFIFQFHTRQYGYIGEISKLALMSVKIPLFNWQIMGHNQNFNFCPAVNLIYL